ncbi:thiolase C-terminal domain-containing protein [Altererythrobacter sp. MF3-039]|uniref:thiolase C-terminal domain-containing protein n=1 Tax=Altererythrobacter sp. MF3-039 TaxID=3252901 RepID=UPI00390CA4A2
MPDGIVRIVGVGMTRFRRPSEGARYEELAEEAVLQALADAGVSYSDLDQIYAGWAYGDTTSAQRALLGLGMTGVPIFNVNNACASGSSAAFLARQAILGGSADCVLALGFEQMPAGALSLFFEDRAGVLDRHVAVSDAILGPSDHPLTPKVFAAAGREHMQRDGISAEAYARIAVKARAHAASNPKAVFREPITVEEVLESREIIAPLTKLQCCPPTSGAAAVVLASDSFARTRGLNAAPAIRGMALTTDTPSAFEGSAIAMVGSDIARSAADKAYAEANIDPSDIDVVELHDCFTVNEALSYEALRLVPGGEAERMIMDGDNTYGGQVVTNPSGGLLAKGHPLGATGPAQLTELVTQLRGQAGARQVDGARIGVQHNVGLNGAAVVTVLEQAN